ncbi:HAD family hydrolase [Catenovulum agarivorans DS-2]|uniref:HAD family hydrolase n=1 Tax=Catenovulum agarivorans DS-2 TaxID=1328313 RepID=W7R3F8_9ALTE|nr:OmpA family protein [Catenovulum agarivorans]EWH12160.1 HAD family hydrolase [Catenovulum agarivorans DS-2]
MKKSFKLATLTAAMLCSAHAMANEPVYVTGGANMFFFDTDVHNVDNGAIGPWLGLGYQIDKEWAVEVNYNMASTETDTASAVDTDVSLLSVNGVYRYAPVGENSLLAKAGLGQYKLDAGSLGDESKVAIRAGAGYEYFIQPQLSATFFWDLLVSFDSTLIESMPSIGLKYQFGQASSKSTKSAAKTTAPKAPVKPVVVDTDADGVADSADLCANTPTGVRVNSQGCPFDRDADGVYDYLDECPMTPEGAKVTDNGCREQLVETVSIQLYVSFPNNSSVVPAEYHDEIKKVADFMRQYPDSTVTLVGHTDSSGSAAYNQMLSEKRAARVAAYLVNNFGLESERVLSRGEGETNPIADNSTAQGREKNRRVTAEISATATK